MWIFNNVWFWASISVGTILCVIAALSFEEEPRTAERSAAGFTAILLFEASRLVLPFLPQPSLDLPRFLSLPLGAGILAPAMAVGGLAVHRLGLGVTTAPNGEENLQTSGVYGIVRHPIYFCDAFWPAGWSVLFNAAYSLALAPLWLFLMFSLSAVEERRLVEEYGEEYEKYQKEVPRLIPGFI